LESHKEDAKLRRFNASFKAAVESTAVRLLLHFKSGDRKDREDQKPEQKPGSPTEM